MMSIIYDYSSWLVSYPVSGVSYLISYPVAGATYLPKYFYYSFFEIGPGEFSKGVKWGVKFGLTLSVVLATATGTLPAGIITINTILSTYLDDNDIE